jgi:hypothetical protein
LWAALRRPTRSEDSEERDYHQQAQDEEHEEAGDEATGIPSLELLLRPPLSGLDVELTQPRVRAR